MSDQSRRHTLDRMSSMRYSIETTTNSMPSPTIKQIFDNDERSRKFQYLIDRYEINREFAKRLRTLQGYEIVFIVDGKRQMSIGLFIIPEL